MASHSLEDLRIIKLYHVFCTVGDMVVDRGFAIKKPEVLRQRNDDPQFRLDFDSFVRQFVVIEPILGAGPVPTALGDRVVVPCGADADSDDDVPPPPTSVKVVNREALKVYGKPKPQSIAPGATSPAEMDAGTRGGGLLVFFNSEETTTVNGVLALRQQAVKKQASAMVVVCQSRIAPAVRREVEEISGRIDEISGKLILTIQLMEEDELVFNVTKHETVPRHIPLSAAETDAFLAAQNLQLAQLPRIKKDDPIVQYFGLERGRVLRIERTSDYAGTYEMFRQVI